MPTIYDVAQEAGVSPKTVSRVLNGESTVKVSTRATVLAAMSKLNYLPSQTARQMRTGQSNIIGLISDEIATTPYAVDIIRGVQAAAWKVRKLVTVINTENDAAVEKRAFELALEYQFDAMIYATYYHREVHLPIEQPAFPLVLLDCYEANGRLPSVVPNEVKGGFDATNTLLDHGHIRIGFITYDIAIPATLGRLEGYKRALAARGIAFDLDLVIAEDGQATGGYRGAQTLLERDNRPTALFCWNDRMAMGAYDAVRKVGLSIPDDLAIIGFDNQEIIASQLHPSLTTMQLPHYEMGKWAVEHLSQSLDNTMDGKDTKSVQFKMDCPPVVRGSV
jgi:LacI family transcriptional regulator